jgi:hypothetical protein
MYWISHKHRLYTRHTSNKSETNYTKAYVRLQQITDEGIAEERWQIKSHNAIAVPDFLIQRKR